MKDKCRELQRVVGEEKGKREFICKIKHKTYLKVVTKKADQIAHSNLKKVSHQINTLFCRS